MRERATAYVGLLLAVSALAWLKWRAPRVLTAEATSMFSADFSAARAVDGSERTEWLLPDRMLGSITVAVSPQRHVATVAVLNARNIAHADRGTKRFRFEALRAGQVVTSGEESFGDDVNTIEWRTFNVGAPIDEVRLTVLSYRLSGGGFGEIEVR